MKKFILIIFMSILILIACVRKQEEKDMTGTTFINDVEFLKQYTDVVVLSDDTEQAQVVVCPQMQGRVMTSTLVGPEGLSFGWMNRELIQSGENNLHINAFGGEDRFWLGPEGGQFSIFFKKDTPFDLEHWYTPAPINEEAFQVVAKSSKHILMQKTMKLKNYSDTQFDLKVSREVSLVMPNMAEKELGISCPSGVKLVAYQSDNKITNTGTTAWKKETGLLSIWILGMFVPSPKTTVVVPYISGPETELGAVVNDKYFGKIPQDRLLVSDNTIFFKGDGEYRSKLGVSRKRAKPFIGSYDAGNNVLTIVQYTLPEDAVDYVNSMWELQAKPYAGDVVNSYNDGPSEPGKKPLGPFYELETSSPAVSLKPGESISHIHRTFHLQGPEEYLDAIAQAVLGVSIEQIKTAFKNN